MSESIREEHPFAPYVRTLGRGPGRSRALTRQEARTAFAMVLHGEADPLQVGAFLMLLRYRGEDPDEIAGLVEAVHDAGGFPATGAVDLLWPSYSDGRTRGQPWFLLSALLLAGSGTRILMHGATGGPSRRPIMDGLAALGHAPASSLGDAVAKVEQLDFAYLPLENLSPKLAELLDLRGILGLRSPVNTVARLLNPVAATGHFDGVFHPPYIAVHLGVAERLAYPRLMVLKGGGGEAERNPAKAQTLHGWDARTGGFELACPALAGQAVEDAGTDHLVAVWRGEARDPAAEATVIGTAAAALIACGAAAGPDEADARAAMLWRERPIP